MGLNLFPYALCSFGALGDTLPAFLTLGGCMQGLDELLCALFGTRFRFASPSAGELWHPSVFKLVCVCVCVCVW